MPIDTPGHGDFYPSEITEKEFSFSGKKGRRVFAKVAAPAAGLSSAPPVASGISGETPPVVKEFLDALLAEDTDKMRRILAVHPDAATWRTRANLDLPMLGYAGCMKSIEPARVLLDHGADINVTDGHGHLSMGKTALMQAAHRGNIELVRFLLARGADPAIQCRTQGKEDAFDFAIHGGHTQVAHILDQAMGGKRWPQDKPRPDSCSDSNSNSNPAAAATANGIDKVRRRWRGCRHDYDL